MTTSVYARARADPVRKRAKEGQKHEPTVISGQSDRTDDKIQARLCPLPRLILTLDSELAVARLEVPSSQEARCDDSATFCLPWTERAANQNHPMLKRPSRHDTTSLVHLPSLASSFFLNAASSCSSAILLTAA